MTKMTECYKITQITLTSEIEMMNKLTKISLKCDDKILPIMERKNLVLETCKVLLSWRNSKTIEIQCSLTSLATNLDKTTLMVAIECSENLVDLLFLVILLLHQLLNLILCQEEKLTMCLQIYWQTECQTTTLHNLIWTKAKCSKEWIL